MTDTPSDTPSDQPGDQLREQLSACLDGQLPSVELDLLLKRVGQDQELCRTLGRYSLAGEALRGNGVVSASTALADRIAAAVAQEHAGPLPTAITRAAVSPARWLRPAAAVLVAASVATVAVWSFQTPVPESEVIAQTAPADADLANDRSIASANASHFAPVTRLTNYVVAHSEYSSPLGWRTVLSGVLSEEDATHDAAATGLDDSMVNDAGALDRTLDGEPPVSVQRL